jgi:hypothetical protein
MACIYIIFSLISGWKLTQNFRFYLLESSAMRFFGERHVADPIRAPKKRYLWQRFVEGGREDRHFDLCQREEMKIEGGRLGIGGRGGRLKRGAAEVAAGVRRERTVAEGHGGALYRLAEGDGGVQGCGWWPRVTARRAATPYRLGKRRSWGYLAGGRWKRRARPWGELGSARTVPPEASTPARTMARPRPEPPASRVRAASGR